MTADHEPHKRSGAEPDESTLTDHLTAIADGHTPRPRWSDVVDRAEGTTVVPLQTGGSRRPLASQNLAIAAACLVVVGLVGAFFATRGEDNDDTEQVMSGPSPDESGEVIDTGWYIPDPMPEGWTVSSIEAASTTLVGPGTLTLWAAPDGSASLTYASEPSDNNMPLEGSPIQLTDEISGTVLSDESAGYPGAVVWENDDLFHLVIGNGIPADEVAAAAQEMAADTDRATSPVDGLELVDHSKRSYEEQVTTDVTVTLRTAAGRAASYTLSPAGGMNRSTLVGTIPVTASIDGQPLELLELTAMAGLDPSIDLYLGMWPGADVSLPLVNYSYVLDGTQDPPTDEEVEALIRSLRPATAEQWRELIEASGLDVDQRLLTADRLEDLSAGAGPGNGQETPADPEIPPSDPIGGETPSTDPAATDLDASTSTSSSGITVLPSRWTPASVEQLDDVSALEFTLTVDRREVVSGRSIRAQLTVTNPTGQLVEINECTFASVATGVVSPSSTESLPLPDLRDCYRTLKLSIPAGATIEWPLTSGVPQTIEAREAVDQRVQFSPGGTLAPGQYLAAVDVPGTKGTVRVAVPVTVTPHPCGGVSAEFIGRYQPGSITEAEAQATADGMTLRVVEIDGVGQAITDDLRCDRVNVAVSAGRILAVDVY